METIGRVRHAFHVKGKKIKEIAREFRLERNTRRLHELAGASFTSAQLRTVQRLCNPWRREAARQLIDAA